MPRPPPCKPLRSRRRRRAPREPRPSPYHPPKPPFGGCSWELLEPQSWPNELLSARGSLSTKPCLVFGKVCFRGGVFGMIGDKGRPDLDRIFQHAQLLVGMGERSIAVRVRLLR